MEMILHVDEMRPNAVDQALKFRWLDELEGRIYNEILASHEGFESFSPSDSELTVPSPYDEMYIYWLFMKMDYINGETERFNNDALMHNTAWVNYANYINRTHAPKRAAGLTVG